MIRIALGWTAAVVSTTVIGTVVQTQINLASIARIHEPIPFGTRIETTLFDLGNFGPVWGVIVALGFLVAFVVAGLLARRWPGRRGLLFPLAGFTAVLAALLVMDAMMPVTVVAAARTLFGQVLLCLAGALGGWIYLAVQRQKGQN